MLYGSFVSMQCCVRTAGIVLFAAALIGCGSANPNLVVGTVGNEVITLSEFEEAYAKTHGGWENAANSTLEDRQKFLELLVKFRLKVREARERGLAHDSAVVEELRSIRTNIATNYMVDKELITPHIQKMYDRKQEYIRASHILFRIGENATPEDTLKAYTKAIEVAKQIPIISFDSLARRYSEDPTAVETGGDLGFFTAGRMVPEFEEACYSLKPGDYTRQPVRTRFGYHLIHVTERINHPGLWGLQHILRRFKQDLSDTSAVTDTVRSLYARLQAGDDFAELARQYSEDSQSAARGGELGLYEISQLPPRVGLFLLENPHDTLPPPLRMPYGYHIIRVRERKPPPTFAEMEKDLRSHYQQTRYSDDYEDYVHGLKKLYKLSFDIPLLHQITHAFDSLATVESAGWDKRIDSETRKKTLFTYSDKSCTVQDFLNDIATLDEFKGMKLSTANVERVVERVSSTAVHNEHVLRTPDRHPAFASLMKEYEEGILLFRIEEDEIRKKVVVNDSLLRQHYEENKNKFKWPHRVKFAEIFVRSEALAESLYARARSGEDFGELAAKYTERPGFKEKRGEWGFQPYTLNDMTVMLVVLPNDSVSPPIAFENGWSVVKVLAKERSRPKTYEEAAAEVAASYQDYAAKKREEEWVAELRRKYNVSIQNEVLKDAFKRTRVDAHSH